MGTNNYEESMALFTNSFFPFEADNDVENTPADAENSAVHNKGDISLDIANEMSKSLLQGDTSSKTGAKDTQRTMDNGTDLHKTVLGAVDVPDGKSLYPFSGSKDDVVIDDGVPGTSSESNNISDIASKPDVDIVTHGEMVYSTSYVASEIGITSQTVRNYSDDFEEFLEGPVSPSGARSYTKKDIELLKKMYNFCSVNKMTRKQAKAYFFGDTAARNSPSEIDDISLDLLVEKMSSKMKEQVQYFFAIGQQELNAQLIAVSKTLAGVMESVMEYKVLIKAQNDEIRGLKEAFKGISDENKKLRERLNESEKHIKDAIANNSRETIREVKDSIKNIDVPDMDIGSIEASVDESKGMIKGMNKILSRMDNRLAEPFVDPEISESLNKISQKYDELLEEISKSSVGNPTGIEELTEKNRQLSEELSKAKNAVNNMYAALKKSSENKVEKPMNVKERPSHSLVHGIDHVSSGSAALYSNVNNHANSERYMQLPEEKTDDSLSSLFDLNGLPDDDSFDIDEKRKRARQKHGLFFL